jgi:hypothetical protein
LLNSLNEIFLYKIIIKYYYLFKMKNIIKIKNKVLDLLNNQAFYLFFILT